MRNRQNDYYVMDASVVINLLATGCFSKILARTPGRFVIVQHVKDEVKLDPLTRKSRDSILDSFIDSGSLQVVELGDDEFNTFVDLVGAPAPDDLDDGEAATIAYANHNFACPIIDENKGRRICRERFPALDVFDTVDLLRMVKYGDGLSEIEFIRGVECALTIGRMRVAEHHLEWLSSMVSREALLGAPGLKRAARP